MKIIIAGSRKFNDYDLLERICDQYISIMKIPPEQVEIVSGKAPGADKLGEEYAKKRGYAIKLFPAPWTDIVNKPPQTIGLRRDGSMYWKLAGHHRNKQMALYADSLIAFHSGTSGTRNMIETAIDKGLTIKIVNI